MNSKQAYDPLEALSEEVERFCKTNLFNPMEVTGFYIQSRCVITELRMARQEVKRLQDEVIYLRNENRRLLFRKNQEGVPNETT